jgi:hypothetical protein
MLFVCTVQQCAMVQIAMDGMLTEDMESEGTLCGLGARGERERECGVEDVKRFK